MLAGALMAHFHALALAFALALILTLALALALALHHRLDGRSFWCDDLWYHYLYRNFRRYSR